MMVQIAIKKDAILPDETVRVDGSSTMKDY